MNAVDIQKVGLWTALAGAVAAIVVLVTSQKNKITVQSLESKYDDIFGI
jgi:hypothetical protein